MSATSHEAGQIRLHNPKQNENILGRRARFHYTQLLVIQSFHIYRHVIVVEDYRFFSRILPAASWTSSSALDYRRVEKSSFFSDLIITRLRSLIRLVFDSHISFLSFCCVYHTRLLLLFLVHNDMEMFVLPFIIVQQRRVITARENTGKLTRFSLVMCSHLLNRVSPISLYGLWFIWNLKSFSRNISNSIQMSGLAKNISGEVIYKAQSDNTRNSRNGHISVIWMTAKKPQNKLE